MTVAPTVTPTPAPLNLTAILAAILVIVTFIAFSPVLRNDFVYWDDNVNVFENPHLSPLTPANLAFFWAHPYQQLYIPISYTVFAILAKISLSMRADPSATGVDTHLNPHVFHAGNLVVHILNVLLVFAILRRLIAARGAASGLSKGAMRSASDRTGRTGDAGIWGEAPAFLGALLFALHPLQVETVAWVTEMRGILAAFFCLASTYFYIDAVFQFAPKGAAPLTPALSLERRGGQPTQPWHVRSYWVAFALTILAFLSKPSAAALPLALFALDYWAVGRPWKSCLVAVLPWVAVTIPLIAVTGHAQPIPPRDLVALWARPLVAGDTCAFYLGKLFIPVNYGIEYGRKPTVVLASGAVYYMWLVPAAIALLIYRVRRQFPLLVAAGWFSLAFVLPVSGLIPFIYQEISTTADRYMYLSMFGPALALAVILARFPSKAAIAVCSVVLAILGVLSFNQTHYWKDSQTLWRHALVVNPSSGTVNYNYGTWLAKQNRFTEAIPLLRRVAGDKQWSDDIENLARALDNYGRGLAQAGQVGLAMTQFRESLKWDTSLAQTHIDYAVGLAHNGDTQGAIDEVQQALAIEPTNDLARKDLAALTAARSASAAKPSH
jgi:hypothetical protein